MPDTPDYDKYRPNSVRFSLQDMGELAARNGSIVTYDRRGEVLFMDDFGHGVIGYQKAGSGGLGNFVLTADNPLLHGFSGRLITNNTNNANESFSKEFGSSDVGRMGFECSLSLTSDDSEISLRLYQYDGTNQKQFRFTIDNVNNIITVLNPAGTNTTIDNLAWFNSLVGTYRYIKLVVDFDNMQYVRVLIDKWEYDLSDYSGFQSAISEQYGIRVQTVFTTKSATSITMDIGHLIVTGNEP